MRRLRSRRRSVGSVDAGPDRSLGRARLARPVKASGKASRIGCNPDMSWIGEAGSCVQGAMSDVFARPRHKRNSWTRVYFKNSYCVMSVSGRSTFTDCQPGRPTSNSAPRCPEYLGAYVTIGPLTACLEGST